MADDKIKVHCTKCSNPFREKLSNLREGYQAQCPNCYRLITFDNASQDRGVQRAMRDARRMRNGYVAPQPDEPQRM